MYVEVHETPQTPKTETASKKLFTPSSGEGAALTYSGMCQVPHLWPPILGYFHQKSPCFCKSPKETPFIFFFFFFLSLKRQMFGNFSPEDPKFDSICVTHCQKTPGFEMLQAHFNHSQILSPSPASAIESSLEHASILQVNIQKMSFHLHSWLSSKLIKGSCS